MSDKEELNKLEHLSNELFAYLFSSGYAKPENVLIFSIIRDWDRRTENWIMPSTKSNKELVDNCHNNVQRLNQIIINILKSSDSEFYLDVEDKIEFFNRKIGLGSLASYYKV